MDKQSLDKFCNKYGNVPCVNIEKQTDTFNQDTFTKAMNVYLHNMVDNVLIDKGRYELLVENASSVESSRRILDYLDTISARLVTIEDYMHSMMKILEESNKKKKHWWKKNM